MFDLELLQATLRPLQWQSSEWQALAAALQNPATAAIRVRPGADEGQLPFVTYPVPWHPRGRFVDYRDRPGSTLPFAAGEYYVQDAGSLLALALLAAQPGERICDLCASPGGKATAILEDLGDAGWLLANEAVQSRVAPLQYNLARHGSTRYAISQFDPDALAAQLGPIFRAVLVDAPCSGQSLVGRGKQSATAFSSAAVQHCAARQSRILDAALRLVGPGGRLIYSTCTFAAAENEEQVQRVLASHPDWKLESDPRLSAWESPLLAGTYRLWPHRDQCGGAFAAKLLRSGASADEADGPLAMPARRRQSDLNGALPAEFHEWGQLAGAVVQCTNTHCWAWAEAAWEPLVALRVPGPEIAFRKGSTWFPAYALAMRRDPHWRPNATVALDDSEASRYVSGETLPRSDRGWRVATWNDRPLGWLKGDGRLAKNHLPKPLRIVAVSSSTT